MENVIMLNGLIRVVNSKWMTKPGAGFLFERVSDYAKVQHCISDGVADNIFIDDDAGVCSGQ